MAKNTKTTTAKAPASNVVAYDYAAAAKALEARIDERKMVDAYRDVDRTDEFGGFDAYVRAAKTNAPTLDEMLHWSPGSPSDLLADKDGKKKSTAFNTAMEDMHHIAAPFASAKTILQLATLMSLASHASKSTVVALAQKANKAVPGHSASRNKDEDLKTAETALAALHKRRDMAEKSNSAADWYKKDIADAIAAVNDAGRLVGLVKEYDRRRKIRGVYFYRLYLAHIADEIVTTCAKKGVETGHYWPRAAMAARTAHKEYLNVTNKPNIADLLVTMRAAAANAIDDRVTAIEETKTTLKVKDEFLKGTEAKDKAIKIGMAVMAGLEKLRETPFRQFYSTLETDHAEMLAIIRKGLGLEVTPAKGGEVDAQVAADAKEAAERKAAAASVKPAKPAAQASERKPAGKVTTPPKAARTKLPRVAKPAATPDAAPATSDSVLADLDTASA